MSQAKDPKKQALVDSAEKLIILTNDASLVAHYHVDTGHSPWAIKTGGDLDQVDCTNGGTVLIDETWLKEPGREKDLCDWLSSLKRRSWGVLSSEDRIEQNLDWMKDHSGACLLPRTGWWRRLEWPIWRQWLSATGPFNFDAQELDQIFDKKPIDRFGVEIRDFSEFAKTFDCLRSSIRAIGFDERRLFEIELAFDEMTNNAWLHAFKRGSGQKFRLLRDDPASQLGSEEHLNIAVWWGYGRLMIQVTDNQGSLSLERILTAIHRQHTRDGVYDTQGRGLFLSWRLSDWLAIQLESGRQTEITAFFDQTPLRARVHPLLIREN